MDSASGRSPHKESSHTGRRELHFLSVASQLPKGSKHNEGTESTVLTDKDFSIQLSKASSCILAQEKAKRLDKKENVAQEITKCPTTNNAAYSFRWHAVFGLSLRPQPLAERVMFECDNPSIPGSGWNYFHLKASGHMGLSHENMQTGFVVIATRKLIGVLSFHNNRLQRCLPHLQRQIHFPVSLHTLSASNYVCR